MHTVVDKPEEGEVPPSASDIAGKLANVNLAASSTPGPARPRVTRLPPRAPRVTSPRAPRATAKADSIAVYKERLDAQKLKCSRLELKVRSFEDKEKEDLRKDQQIAQLRIENLQLRLQQKPSQERSIVPAVSKPVPPPAPPPGPAPASAYSAPPVNFFFNVGQQLPSYCHPQFAPFAPQPVHQFLPPVPPHLCGPVFPQLPGAAPCGPVVSEPVVPGFDYDRALPHSHFVKQRLQRKLKACKK